MRNLILKEYCNMKNTSNKKRFRSNHKKVRAIAEVAILLSLATVLSVFKLYQLPYGGALTLASMFPLLIISYRHGTLIGMASGLIYGILQQLLSLSYIQGMTFFSAVMVIILDYALAFAVIGIGGIFKKAFKSPVKAFVSGALLGCILRYTCHTIAGCTVWAGLSIPTNAALVYSLLYNAAYMIPETLITVAAAYYLSSCIDFNAEMPTRIKNQANGIKISPLDIGGSLAVLSAIIADIIIIFSHTQKESGEFDITLINTVSGTEWIIIAVITAVAGGAFAVLHLISNHRKKEFK